MEEQQKYEIVQSETVQLGTIQVAGPGQVIQQATAIADELARLVNDRKLFSNISGKRYVRVEGWNTLGAMLGIIPREVSVIEHETGDFESTVELVRASDGVIIGRGSAILGFDESSWASRPRYARRSMATTRATGKAFRLGFSWIMALAGYEPTPAEEMDGIVEGQYSTKADPKNKKLAGKSTIKAKPKVVLTTIYKAVVDAKLSENVHSAKKSLNRCTTGYDTPEKAIAWMKIYRAWRDMDDDPVSAAASANKGEAAK